MLSEEWLSSRLKLCQLNTNPTTGPLNVRDSEEVVVNTRSYPQPNYDQSSIFLTLETYSDALNKACAKKSCLKTVSRDQNIPETIPVQTDILHCFAEMLSEEILNAAVKTGGTQDEKGMKSHSDKSCNITESTTVTNWTISNQEKLANKLASEIYTSAIEEVTRHGVLAGNKSEELSDVLSIQMDETGSIFELQSESARSSMYRCDQEGLEMEVDAKADEFDSTGNQNKPFHNPCSRTQSSGSTTYPSALNGMANIGSLDYPDAPPSTPLLPEMIKSRASFSRKLKGGLAKEFLPSPPPPTPKDQQGESITEGKCADTSTDKSEFMVRLMRSLSLACSQHGDLNEKEDGREDEDTTPNTIPSLSDYAAQVSADIMHCITTAQPSSKVNRKTPAGGVQFLADHLAEEIVLMSLAEVMGSKRVDGKREEHSHTLDSKQEMASSLETSAEDTPTLLDSLKPVSNPKDFGMEPLRAMAGRFIANTLVQAFSELGGCASPHASSQQFPGAASDPMPCERGKDQNPNLGMNITKSHQTETSECCNSTSEPKYIELDSKTMTSIAEHFLAQNIAQEVVERSIQEASKSLLSSNLINVNSERLCPSKASIRSAEQSGLTGIISDQTGTNVQEIQCALLWAAASQMGIAAIRLDLPDKQLQQQLSSLSVQAQFQGWTVGHLLASVLQYCEDLQTASRGHFKSFGSLLGHLLLLADPSLTQ